MEMTLGMMMRNEKGLSDAQTADILSRRSFLSSWWGRWWRFLSVTWRIQSRRVKPIGSVTREASCPYGPFPPHTAHPGFFCSSEWFVVIFHKKKNSVVLWWQLCATKQQPISGKDRWRALFRLAGIARKLAGRWINDTISFLPWMSCEPRCQDAKVPKIFVTGRCE